MEPGEKVGVAREDSKGEMVYYCQSAEKNRNYDEREGVAQVTSSG